MPKKILIIEDEENLVKLLSVNLKTRGFSVVAASDGEEGLEMAFAEMPDAVILDVRLPSIDGWEICQRLKNNEKTKHIPVIFLTAASQKKDAEKASEVGGDLYLTKPFDPLELADIVEKKLSVTKEPL